MVSSLVGGVFGVVEGVDIDWCGGVEHALLLRPGDFLAGDSIKRLCGFNGGEGDAEVVYHVGEVRAADGVNHQLRDSRRAKVHLPNLLFRLGDGLCLGVGGRTVVDSDDDGLGGDLVRARAGAGGRGGSRG